MSGVSFLERLLDGCEVKCLPLGDVTQYEQPTKYLVASTNYSDEFDTPVLTAGKTFILGYTNEVNGIYKASEYPVIIFDDFTTANKWVDFDFKAKSSAMKMISSSDEGRFLIKYIYYWLNTLPSELVDGDHKRQWIGNYTNKKIPIPCPENPKKSLEIQAEIVRILDAFTSLTAELTAELNTRKQQYSYYRDELLNFEDKEVDWKPLGELCSIGVGQAPLNDEIGEYPFVNAGTTPSGYVSAYNTEPDTITTPSRGQGGIGYVGYQSKRFWCGPLCYRIRSTSKSISTRFLYHVMSNSMKDIIGLANMTGVPALNKKELVGFSVPIPSPDEQLRIVAILDKFDALTNSLSAGLPREIELRQKQYEHYRDMLLSFPKPVEVVA